ncbi:hypothetical protein F8M41_017215 [Gigaspora margarita]|uniref:Uncharacterized protein n=1 Tax=Gigaspora margarita TaxID=4874 RepID=A0A8H4B331_GIGMA|nr:hypothetical protein F8M41_017215 [Gigaspora margarita]
MVSICLKLTYLEETCAARFAALTKQVNEVQKIIDKTLENCELDKKTIFISPRVLLGVIKKVEELFDGAPVGPKDRSNDLEILFQKLAVECEAHICNWASEKDVTQDL